MPIIFLARFRFLNMIMAGLWIMIFRCFCKLPITMFEHDSMEIVLVKKLLHASQSMNLNDSLLSLVKENFDDPADSARR